MTAVQLVLLCGSADMPLLSHAQLSRLDDTTASWMAPIWKQSTSFKTCHLQYQPIQVAARSILLLLSGRQIFVRAAAAAAAAKQLHCSAVVRWTRSLAPIPWWDVMKHGQRSGAMRAGLWQMIRRALGKPTCLPSSWTLTPCLARYKI